MARDVVIPEELLVTKSPSGTPILTQAVLFAASKSCSNSARDPACSAVPESPLPPNIYGSYTDHHPNHKYNRSRFLSSAMAMGQVSDLRSLYKYATDLLNAPNENHDSQEILSQIFGEQERQRTVFSRKYRVTDWKSYILSKLSVFRSTLYEPKLHFPPTYDFGISLDYGNSIFQMMEHSVEDMSFVTFKTISTPPAAESLGHASNIPASLSQDLVSTLPPIPKHQSSSSASNPPIPASDDLPSNQITWFDEALAANMVVPGGSVPAVLNVPDEALGGETWRRMWFYGYARGLVRNRFRGLGEGVVGEGSVEPEDGVTEMRESEGGVWTGDGRVSLSIFFVFGDCGKGERRKTLDLSYLLIRVLVATMVRGLRKLRG
jgi:hypothetical protein